MCYDIDSSNNSAHDLNQLIVVNANDNGYDLIWFYEDIEQVYLGKSIPSSTKKASANQFVRNRMIDKVEISNLTCSSSTRKNTSNILLVIDQYLSRK